MVGYPAASALPDAGIPDLRYSDACGGDAGYCRADPGHGSETLQAACSQPGIPAVPACADHGEQVARGALRIGWKADRLWEENRSPGPGLDLRIPALRGRRGG